MTAGTHSPREVTQQAVQRLSRQIVATRRGERAGGASAVRDKASQASAEGYGDLPLDGLIGLLKTAWDRDLI